jgi:hypothetical protein
LDFLPAQASQALVSEWPPDGETNAPLSDVKALRTYEDGGSWIMTPQQERHRSRMPQKTKAQGELF